MRVYKIPPWRGMAHYCLWQFVSCPWLYLTEEHMQMLIVHHCSSGAQLWGAHGSHGGHHLLHGPVIAGKALKLGVIQQLGDVVDDGFSAVHHTVGFKPIGIIAGRWTASSRCFIFSKRS